MNMTLNNLCAVVVSKHAYPYDKHVAYAVNDRVTRRLVGHVGKLEVPLPGVPASWAYLHFTDERDSWTIGGWTRADAVDHLMSADSPSGAYVAGVA
jgi:hypothetical protein